MTIKIEVTTAPDVQVLAAIHGACFPRSWDAAAIADMLEIPGTNAFIVAHKAFGLLRYLGDDAEILTLAVMPDCRRNGLGDAILSAMGEWAKANQARTLFLEVGENNSAAIKLYKKQQFRVLSRRKYYYQGGEDAIVMRREMS